MKTQLGNEPAAEADRHRVSPRTGLKLRKQVTHVRLHRLLRQEESLTDLAVNEAVGDELAHLDLPRRRLLLERAYGSLKWDHLSYQPTPASRHLLEVARVRQVAAEDLFALRCIHRSAYRPDPHSP